MLFGKAFNLSYSVPKPRPIAQSVCWGLENRRSLVRSLARPIVSPSINDSHCDRIHSFLNAVPCFDKLSVVSTMVMWESSKWLGKSIVGSTGQKNSWKAWIGALATMI